mmetsp:Transcript_18988/g.41220  ORF Transcript_18988/g.41220 Transcript_18988/m.41220 type:complete len:125 (-) Transcript_18988:1246-1620(-)
MLSVVQVKLDKVFVKLLACFVKKLVSNIQLFTCFVKELVSNIQLFTFYKTGKWWARNIESAPPENSILPSQFQSTVRTLFVCGASVCNGMFERMSHILIVWSCEEETRMFSLEGHHLTEDTHPL